ncbi:MAG: AAA family ATPase, partial [Candidatus Kerfeldbacteria bacterium]|nr:AAA family ATPase [Candidatus Kerfeldbacteria bacterium]
MPTYYFMIGIPGSGKSTCASMLASGGAVIVSPDAYRERYRRKSDAEIFAAARAEVALHL